MIKELMQRMPACQDHRDCFANEDGICVVLNNTDFGRRNCPFYKSCREHISQRVASAQKLKATGNVGLIEKYYGSVENFDWQLESELKKL